MKYDDLLDLVKKRRSIRRFKPDPVPEGYIDQIIEVARWAPSSLNQQPWEFVIVKELELRKQILQYCADYRKFAQRMNTSRGTQLPPVSDSAGGRVKKNIAPVFILLFGDTRAKKAEPRDLRWLTPTIQNIFTSSLASAYLYMHLAATSLGLASSWSSIVRTPYPHCMIKDLLGIPEELELHDMMMLGYPAEKPRSKTMREGKMVHYENCGTNDFRTDEEVLDFTRISLKGFPF